MSAPMKRKPLFQQIWHGDSREQCLKFREGSVDCIITDPPFGVDNKSNMAVTQSGKEHARKIAGDATPEEALMLFDQVMRALLPKTADECDVYIFTAYQVLDRWMSYCKDPLGIFIQSGFKFKAVLVWEKDGPGMGDLNSWGQGHEFILYLKRGSRVNTAKRRSGVLHFSQLRPSALIHPHEKPLPLLREFINQSTDPRDFVVDPFGGSGSLARACRDSDRSCVAIEYDEVNFRKAKEKLEGSQGGLLG